MKTIAVVSSKGGVGKTTVSVSLAHFFSLDKKQVTLIDGDVNAPNVAKWFEITKWDYVNEVKVFPLPNKYKNCKDLKVICNGREFPVELEKRGEVKVARNYAPPHQNYTINIISGDISKGKTGSGKVVEGVLNHKIEGVETNITLIDTAPGTGYPVLTAIQKADYVIIITEATKLGLQDMIKLYDIVKAKNKELGVIVNKADLDKTILEKIKQITAKHFLGAIPTSLSVKEALENKKPVEIEEMKKIYEKIIKVNSLD